MSLFLVAAFCLFANTFGNAWTYDDFPVIVNNLDVRSLGAFLENSRPGRPLREITFLLDHALFGLEPTGYHIQNIFWHGLNGGLVFTLTRRLGGARPVAALASALFLAHPIQVEVVANISHRKDSLALAFSLLATLALTMRSDGARSRIVRGVYVTVCFLLACLAKENVLLLPLIWLVYAAFCSHSPHRRLYGRLAGGLLLSGSLGIAVMFLYFGAWESFARGMEGALHLKANVFSAVSLSDYYRMVLKSWSFLWFKIVVPTDLAPEYTYPLPRSWADPWVVSTLCAVTAYGVALVRSASRRPLLFGALLWAGAFWLPVSNLWPLTYFAADRYLYAPLAGVAVAVALGLDRLIGRRRILFVFLSAVWLALLVLVTWKQNRVWHSPRTLWAHALEVSPDSSFTLNNMGMLALESGDTERALRLLHKASENPFNPNPLDNLGWIYEKKLGDVERALDYYRRFIAVARNNPQTQERAVFLQKYLLQKYGVDFSQIGRPRNDQ